MYTKSNGNNLPLSMSIRKVISKKCRTHLSIPDTTKCLFCRRKFYRDKEINISPEENLLRNIFGESRYTSFKK